MLLGAYAFGDVLENPDALEVVEIAIVLNLPANDLTWCARPQSCSGLPHLLEIENAPVGWYWRPAAWPVSSCLIQNSHTGAGSQAVALVVDCQAATSAACLPAPVGRQSHVLHKSPSSASGGRYESGPRTAWKTRRSKRWLSTERTRCDYPRPRRRPSGRSSPSNWTPASATSAGLRTGTGSGSGGASTVGAGSIRRATCGMPFTGTWTCSRRSEQVPMSRRDRVPWEPGVSPLLRSLFAHHIPAGSEDRCARMRQKRARNVQLGGQRRG